jgi:hypothetical protein
MCPIVFEAAPRHQQRPNRTSVLLHRHVMTRTSVPQRSHYNVNTHSLSLNHARAVKRHHPKTLHQMLVAPLCASLSYHHHHHHNNNNNNNNNNNKNNHSL